MSYHIIDISTEGVTLSVKDNQLVCKSPDGSVKSLPMEDIGAVLVNTFSASFHNSFLISAAKNKIAVIVCEKFRPVSLVLPVQRSSDTILTRAQIDAPRRLLDALWMKTIDAKCQNQYELVERIHPKESSLFADFRVSLGRKDIFKEGNCARCYWDLYSEALGVRGFRRLRDSGGLNSMLNYAYAVLEIRVEQKLLATGLDPLYGIGHATRERSLPLAYDMMEPFRCAVDEMIYEWVSERGPSEDVLVVDKAYKVTAHELMQRRFPYRDAKSVRLDDILDSVLRSFKKALVSGKLTEYHPWTRRSSRWDV